MRTVRILLAFILCTCSLAAADRPATPLRAGIDSGPSIAAIDHDGPRISIRERAAAFKARRLSEFQAAPRPRGAGSRTVRVDCTRGQSIQDAIDKSSGPVTIEIHGICTEHVRIDYRTVTLRGADPASDGVSGATIAASDLAAVELYNTTATIENLAFVDSLAAGIGMWNCQIDLMTNCRIEGNANTGIHVSAGSWLNAADLTIANNGTMGIRVQRSSIGFCMGCTLSDNNWAAISALGGFLSLQGSAVSGLNGLQATNDSYADLDCVNVDEAHAGYPCSMTAARRSAAASDSSEVYFLSASSLQGSLAAYDRSAVYLDTTQQIATGLNAAGYPIPNDIGEGSNLVMWASQLFGTTYVNAFGRAVLYNPSTLAGSIVCQQAGDAWVDDIGSTVLPGSSITGCEHAQTP